jgi:hypothetical protein
MLASMVTRKISTGPRSDWKMAENHKCVRKMCTKRYAIPMVPLVLQYHGRVCMCTMVCHTVPWYHWYGSGVRAVARV